MDKQVTCHHCKLAKEVSEFGKNKSRENGLDNYCKPCRKEYRKQWYSNNSEKAKGYASTYNEKNLDKVRARWRNYNKNNPQVRAKNTALRRAQKLLATPAWIDHEEVAYIYRLAAERGLEVDHIVPLNHHLVCGLHVQDNLRCIPKNLNRWKSNKLLKHTGDTL